MLNAMHVNNTELHFKGQRFSIKAGDLQNQVGASEKQWALSF